MDGDWKAGGPCSFAAVRRADGSNAKGTKTRRARRKGTKMLTLHSDLPPELENIAYRSIGCSIDVHRIVGAGYREIIYQRAMCLALDAAGLAFEAEKPVMVRYHQWEIPGHKLDIVVGGLVLLELKAVPRLKPIHTSQVKSYLKAGQLRLGLLMNFNVAVMREGIKRVVL